MKIEVRIPQQGLTIESVTIVRWLKNVGDTVKEGDILFEIESEKAVLEIESPAAGKLSEILVEAENEAAVGETVALIESEE